MTVKPEEVATYDWNNYRSTNINEVIKSRYGNYILDGTKLKDLHNMINFTEARIKCSKENHNRVLHVALTGSEMLNYIIGDSESFSNVCKSVRFLPDDTSLMGKSPCNDLRAYKKPTMERLYSHLVYKSYNYHIVISDTNRLECDDEKNSAGHWSFYLR